MDQDSNADLTEEHEAGAVERVREIVEDALQNSFGRDTVFASNQFQGKLSTVPSRVHQSVTSAGFYEVCGTFSGDLEEHLTARGLKAPLSVSTHPDTNFHGFLVTMMDRVEVLIDPSIEQFLKGHRHTFVGTRRQLRDIVLNQTGEGKPYQIWNTRSRNNPQEAFERIWGNTSRPYR